MEIFGITHSYVILFDLFNFNYNWLDAYMDELD